MAAGDHGLSNALAPSGGGEGFGKVEEGGELGLFGVVRKAGRGLGS
jgi:hypothetical protein